MSGEVTWRALTFVAGIVIGSVLWTFMFWALIDERIDQRVIYKLYEYRLITSD